MSRRAMLPAILVLVAGLPACDSHPTAPADHPHLARFAAPTGYGAPQDLGVAPPAEAYAISETGSIVGESRGELPQRAFRRSADGTVEYLEAVRSGAHANARAVNAAGFVAGNDFVNQFGEHLPHYSRPVRWAPDGTPTVLIEQDGYAALGMNGLGHVVGTSVSGAWRWTPETGVEILPGLGGCLGGWCERAHDINDAGAVVGYLRVPFDSRPFFWSQATGTVHIASTGGEARAINSHGQVTGHVGSISGSNARAFVWSQAEGLILIDPPQGWLNIGGTGINEAGAITGWVANDLSGSRAFVWTEQDGVTVLEGLPSGIGRDAGRDIDSEGTVVGSSATASHLYAVRWSESPPPNSPPTIRPLDPERTVRVGETLVFDVEADDADGDRIEIQAAELPAGATFTEQEATAGYTRGRFAWTPEPGQEGLYAVTFTAIDEHGAQSAPATVSIRVDPPTPPPCTAPGLSLEAWSGSTPGTISLSDPDVWVMVWNVEAHIPPYNPRAVPDDLRLGETWDTATRARSFSVLDANQDGNRDVRLRFETQRLVADGNLGTGTEEITVWGEDRVSGERFCGTTAVTVQP